MSEQEAILSGGVLDDTEQVSSHDERAHPVKDVDHGEPTHLGSSRHGGRLSGQALLEEEGHDQEHPKQDELQNETAQNDHFAQVRLLLSPLAPANVAPPTHWMRKQVTSPQTKILVNQVGRMGDKAPPWTALIVLPRII